MSLRSLSSAVAGADSLPLRPTEANSNGVARRRWVYPPSELASQESSEAKSVWADAMGTTRASASVMAEMSLFIGVFINLRPER